MNNKELLAMAFEASRFSYSPYSKFRVGAALLCGDGTIITGTNVENRSFGLTICAERSAIVSAVGRGIQDFKALAISCPDADYPVSPCGACRQVMSEFADPGMPVYFQGGTDEIISTTAGELFPFDALKELGRQ
jgi:cytidine deaminase